MRYVTSPLSDRRNALKITPAMKAAMKPEPPSAAAKP